MVNYGRSAGCKTCKIRKVKVDEIHFPSSAHIILDLLIPCSATKAVLHAANARALENHVLGILTNGILPIAAKMK
jgi:hypothetical protein